MAVGNLRAGSFEFRCVRRLFMQHDGHISFHVFVYALLMQMAGMTFCYSFLCNPLANDEKTYDI